ADVTIEADPVQRHELRLGGGIGGDRDRDEFHLRAEWMGRQASGLTSLRLGARAAYVVLPSVFDPKQHGPEASAEAELVRRDLGGRDVTLRASAVYALELAPGYRLQRPHGRLGLERGWWLDRVRLAGGVDLAYVAPFEVDRMAFPTLPA